MNPINSNKNKLNSEIIFIHNLYPNGGIIEVIEPARKLKSLSALLLIATH